MVATLWYLGVAIDPGRLIDDTDTAYYLTVVASYRQLLTLKDQQHAEEEAAANRQARSLGV
jgi:hypothetical protein